MRAALLGILLVASISAVSTAAFAQTAMPETAPEGVLAVAVLGLADGTADGSGAEKVLPIVREEAAKRWRLLDDEQVRGVLREHRIRSLASLDQEDGARIAEATGAEALLLGSVILYQEGENPEIAVALRLLAPSDLRVIAAASAASSGLDHASLFEIGRVRDPDLLARDVVREAIARLAACLDGKRTGPTQGRIAIVPFDGSPQDPQDGPLVSDLLLPVLFAHGYDIVEPGLLRRLFERLHVAPRGGIDLETLRALREDLAIDLAITGEVDEAVESQGDAQMAMPRLAYGVRLVDARTGHLFQAIEEQTGGERRAGLLPLGWTTSLGRLVEESLDRLVAKIEEQPREDHASRR
ncbi:MAG: hypothetical protein QUU85_01320 [Candidatus Eisenbacteria bacterium]|nr:hypothetical protein [Candidatus Eisenbacteria bacterium]